MSQSHSVALSIHSADSKSVSPTPDSPETFVSADEPPTYDEPDFVTPTPNCGMRLWGNAQKEGVRQTICTLIHDLVQPGDHPTALALVRHCARACAANSVSFSAILQNRSIAGHSPLYWAVINERGADFILMLIRYATPLVESAHSELRLACLASANTSLFTAIHHELYIALDYTDRMLLAASPPDSVTITKLPHFSGYDASIVLHQFYKRMIAGRVIPVDFMSHGRIWRISFWVAYKSETYFMGMAYTNRFHKGDWVVKFEVLENPWPLGHTLDVALKFKVGETPFEVQLNKVYKKDECMFGYISSYPIHHEGSTSTTLDATLSVHFLGQTPAESASVALPMEEA